MKDSIGRDIRKELKQIRETLDELFDNKQPRISRNEVINKIDLWIEHLLIRAGDIARIEADDDNNRHINVYIPSEAMDSASLAEEFVCELEGLGVRFE